MTQPVPRPGILEIKPYVGGKSSAAGSQKPIKLSSNEGALGPSPKAIAAAAAAAAEMHRYPDSQSAALRWICRVSRSSRWVWSKPSMPSSPARPRLTSAPGRGSLSGR
jgi:histidinol-phosphate/aromatic aminotransferase/cobyric acid decarboxylase-like protein